VATSSTLAASEVSPATRSSSLLRSAQLVQFGRAPVEVLPALAEGLRTVFDALELLVQPLLAVGEAGFPALEVTAQLAHFVLDRADLLFDLAAALGGLLGFLAGSLQDPGGFGLGAGTDVLGFPPSWRHCRAGCGRRSGRAGSGWHSGSGARRQRARIPPRATRLP
jgi:hypothetical protein